MKIEFLDKNNSLQFEESAKLLQENFECWSDIQDAKDEIEDICSSYNITLTAVDENHVIGLIGAHPQYGGNVWEMHPLVVKKEKQKRGIGKLLVKAIENEVAKRGGITIYLGTDDESNSTSLSNTDIYENIYDKISNVINLNNHPFEFYLKCGYKIVGIIPDANGYGKPDIMMAKRVLRL
jgi:aminoglycoside 6'-N-acetyltransferase I